MVSALALFFVCFVSTSAGEIWDELSAGQQVLDVEAALKLRITSSKVSAQEWSETVQGEEKNSIVLQVVHRDSLSSSSSSSNTSLVKEILQERLKRDAARVDSINARVQLAAMGVSKAEMKPLNGSSIDARFDAKDFSSSIISGLAQGSGEYFTRLGVGTPPRYTYMVLDTGSDIMWIQCLPCAKCYGQTDPLFNPAASSTYRKVPCATPLCKKLDISGCRNKRYCEYQVSYGDGSFTVGDFSTETLTFRGQVIRRVALGCGHDNEGLFIGAAGLLGLGRGSLSFPSQTGAQFSKRFSYCLVDRSASGTASSLIFGKAAIPKSAIFTPLLSNPKLDTFYYVELVGISVGGRRLTSIPASVFRMDATGNGGVIIDSGTSVTRLVDSAYSTMRDAFRVGTGNLKSAGGFSLFDTCYDLSGLKTVKVPTLVFHFQGGAHISLPATNYLIPVDSSATFCFAFAGNTGGLSIIGNIQQQGYRVVFDSLANRVGFKAGSCLA